MSCSIAPLAQGQSYNGHRDSEATLAIIGKCIMDLQNKFNILHTPSNYV